MPLIQQEPKKIYMNKNTDYSAMQGPAPTGYHVPSKDEWTALCGILISTFSMAENATTAGTYLKMPMAGYRNNSSSSVVDAGVDGMYWCSTAFLADSAYHLVFHSSALNAQHGGSRARGLPVRCFKDTPIIPDSSWTVLYQGTGSAGVFQNSTDGLISVSGDGTTWYTIQDKNLGATTVYNQGDTLTDANCGKLYQWGNNYGFSYSGTVTTSSTKVNASTYGPGNYYSSSTFITVSSSPYDRSSVQNDNLWGGVSGLGGDTEIQKVYMWKEPYTDYSAMQGPCPSGFHVPMPDEVTSIKTILTTFSVGHDKILMPMAGQRAGTATRIDGVGNYGYWWTCELASQYYAYDFRISGQNENISVNNNEQQGRGCSIRPFKDAPVVPDGTRTVLHQGTGDAGIYHNSTLGLISLSTDGITRITIADKNLGATSTDISSTDSYGYYYQWGNNYGFATTGSVTTSATPVDATGYGPGNYYNSSTFITASHGTYGYYWQSTLNQNLWGRMTGTQPGGGDIQIRPTIIPTQITTDYTTSAAYSNIANNTTYYYGAKFTALKTGSIKSVIFFVSTPGVLKIAQGNYASATGTEYSVSSGSSEYVLSTPYQITAGQNYVVVFKAGASSSVYYKYISGGTVLPATGTAVKYDYATLSSNSNSYTDRVWQIKGLTIEYTP